MPSKKDEEPKSIDVAKSAAKPSETSRPLVGSREIVKDPMVVVEEDKSDEKQEQAAPVKRKVIKPLSDDIKPDEPEQVDSGQEPEGADDASTEKTESAEQTADKAEDSKTHQDPAADSTGSEKPAEAAQPAGPVPEDPDEESRSQEEAVVEAVVEQVKGRQSNKEEQAATEANEQAKKEKLQKLIETKKYFLPIGELTRRKQNRQALVVLIILVLLCLVYLAADFELINLPVDLPVEFIKSSARIG